MTKGEENMEEAEQILYMQVRHYALLVSQILIPKYRMTIIMHFCEKERYEEDIFAIVCSVACWLYIGRF